MSGDSLPIFYDPSISEADYENLALWSNIFNGLSLFGAALVVLVVALSNFYKFRASKRLYFRMSMWIGLSDVLFSCFSFVNVDNDNVCPTFTFITFLCNLLYIFLTTSISVNLHLTLLCEQTPLVTKIRRRVLKESVIVYVSIALAFIFSFPQFITSIIYDQCVIFHIPQEKNMKVLGLWLTVGFWEYICFIYTTIVIILVVRKLNSHSQKIPQGVNIPITPDLHDTYSNPSYPQVLNNSTFQTEVVSFSRHHARRPSEISNVSIELGNQLRLIARRIIFYPLIPIFTQSFYVLINTYFLYENERTLIPMYLFYLIPYSAGLLNSLVFFILDPALPDILSELKQRIGQNKVEKKLKRDDSVSEGILNFGDNITKEYKNGIENIRKPVPQSTTKNIPTVNADDETLLGSQLGQEITIVITYSSDHPLTPSMSPTL